MWLNHQRVTICFILAYYVTNQTQTCFRSTQVVNCLPGVWVLVLYWWSFYFFVVIVESLLRIFVYRLFCFRCSAVCFGAFCTEGNAVGFKFLWYVVFNKVCEIALSEELATQLGVLRRSIKVSSFEMHKFDPFLPHSGSVLWELVHSYVLGCLWIVTVCCNTVGRHG